MHIYPMLVILFWNNFFYENEIIPDGISFVMLLTFLSVFSISLYYGPLSPFNGALNRLLFAI